MKKLFCLSFVLFATTLCSSASAGNTDQMLKTLTIPTKTGDMPLPCPGRKTPPPCSDSGN
jgi:hypothetical protein